MKKSRKKWKAVTRNGEKKTDKKAKRFLKILQKRLWKK